jgi:epoxyqueuosine reductase
MCIFDPEYELMIQNKSGMSDQIRRKAAELGFEQTGFARAKKLEEESRRLEDWLNKGYHGKMAWMENHFELRTDPGRLVPGAKTVISFLYNYYTDVRQEDPEAPLISTYAYGRDYHKVVRKKLQTLWKWIQETYGMAEGRCFVDSAPVMEREWAKRSGLGWLGKNTLLIHPRKGSYFFLGVIITDLELEPDHPVKDFCGTCTRCIDACPTEAFSASGYLLDASKCISYLTIELKEEIPPEFSGKMANYVFGCDICQDVCPWNRFSQKHHEPDFEPSAEMLSMSKHDWSELTEDLFDRLFKSSPLKRPGYNRIKQNLQFLQKNTSEEKE